MFSPHAGQHLGIDCPLPFERCSFISGFIKSSLEIFPKEEEPLDQE